MSPATYRRGGRGVDVRYAIARSPLGQLLVAATSRGVCAVRLGDSAATLAAGLGHEFHAASLRRDDARLKPLVRRVLALLDGRGPDARLPLDIRATAFQRRVWQALRDNPAGARRAPMANARALRRPPAGPAAGLG